MSRLIMIDKKNRGDILVVSFLFLIIILQFVNLYSLTGVYTQDDYLNALLPNGLHDYGRGIFVAGRTVPGFLLFTMSQGFADFWFSSAAQAIMILTCFLFISVSVKQLTRELEIPFYVILSAITIAFCHPYWFDILRFSVASLAIALGFVFAMLAIIVRTRESSITLVIILQLLSISCYQTIVYFFIVFELLYLLIYRGDRKFKRLFDGFLIIIVSLVLYLVELKVLSGLFYGILNESDYANRLGIGGTERGGFYLSIASILEFIFYSFRTLFLDGVIFNGYSKLIVLFFLLSSIVLIFKRENYRIVELLFILILLFFMFSSPIHAVIREDHYSHRVLIHVCLIIGSIPIIFYKYQLSKKYLLIAVFLLPIILLANSFYIVSVYEESLNYQKSIIQRIENDFFANNVKGLNITIVPNRGTNEWDQVSKGVLYTPQIYAGSSEYEVLAYESNIPFFRDNPCEPMIETIVNIERVFYSMNIDVNGCATLAYTATEKPREENALYGFLKEIKRMLTN